MAAPSGLPPSNRTAAGDHVPSAEDRLRAYRDSGDRAVRNQVVEDHRWLAVVIAKDYVRSGEPLEDLVQVACVGLVKAAERFDPDYGVAFCTYAAVTARGEVRRYYRDAAWSLHVPRRLKSLRDEIRAATDVLTERVHRSPTTSELADYLGVDRDEILACECADRNFRSASFDPGDGAHLDRGHDDGAKDAMSDVDSWDAFQRFIAPLPARLRHALELRYAAQMKQTEIAAVIGVSQVQVSRLLRDAQERLRQLANARSTHAQPSEASS